MRSRLCAGWALTVRLCSLLSRLQVPIRASQYVHEAAYRQRDVIDGRSPGNQELENWHCNLA